MHLGLLLIVALGGCSWSWESFERDGGDGADGGGADAALRDAEGPDGGDDAGSTDGGVDEDAGPSCAGPSLTECGAGEICARPSSVASCCRVSSCVPRGDRPLGGARAYATGGWVLDGVPDEEHWTDGRPPFPLVQVDAPSVPSSMDADVRFLAAYNSQFLWLSVRVEDDTTYAPTIGMVDLDAIDALEVYVDFDPTRDDAVHENRMLFPIQPGVRRPTQRDQSWASPVAAMRQSAGGWDIEVEIAFADSGTSVGPGDVIALDVHLRDFESSSTPVELWRWGACPGGRPIRETAGLLVLSDEVTPSALAGCMGRCTDWLCVPTGVACARGGAAVCP